MALVALAGLASLEAGAAQPTYEQARAFTDALVRVRDEAWTQLESFERAAAYSRNVNQLPVMSRRVFGPQEINTRFWRCEVAARDAVTYWSEIHNVASTRTLPDRTAASAIARAGFSFGESYRMCRDLVETLDQRPRVPPECLRIIDVTQPAGQQEKPLPSHCKR